MSESWDVFLSHNSNDKAHVRRVARALERNGITVFYDEWDLVPGREWQEELKDALMAVKAVAVFVGVHDVGDWQRMETNVANSRHTRSGIPVIPVLLPGGPDPVNLPGFLESYHSVDMRDGINDRGLRLLACGIKGIKPKDYMERWQSSPAHVSIEYDLDAISELLDGEAINKAIVESGSFNWHQDSTATRAFCDRVDELQQMQSLLLTIFRADAERYTQFEERIIKVSIEQDVAELDTTALPVVTSIAPLLGRLIVETVDCRKAWNASCPPAQHGEIDGSAAMDQQLFDCIGFLAPLSRGNDGVIPLIRFLHKLSEQVAGIAKERLSDWIGTTLRQRSVDPEEAKRALRNDVAYDSKGESPRWVVELSAGSKKSLKVKAWLVGVRRPAKIEEEVDDAELPELLNRLRGEILSRDIDLRDVVFEIFLPKAMLCRTVDQERIRSGKFFRPLGHDHVVVARPMERQSDKEIQQGLDRRWPIAHMGTCTVVDGLLQADGRNPLAVHLSAEPTDIESFFNKLTLLDRFVCGVLTYSPRIESADSKPDVLDALIYSGVPAAILPRHLPDKLTDAISAQLTGLVNDQPLNQVANAVRELRRKASEGDGSWPLGKHLTLLWDNPDWPHPEYDVKNSLSSPHE